MTFLPKRLTRPLRRAAVLIMAWTYRHTLMTWVRSLAHELRRHEPLDLGRLRTLLSALVRISADPLTSNAPEIRSVRLVGDNVEIEVDDEWPGAHRLTAGGVQFVVSSPDPVAAASSGV